MRQLIKQATEAITVLAVASYAIGFIIVNSYLLTFGYSSSSLFKTTYISAGILFLLLATPLSLSLYSFVVSSQIAIDGGEGSADKRRGLNFVGMATLVIGSYFLLNNIVTNDLRKSHDDLQTWEAILAAIGVLASLVVLILESLNKTWSPVLWVKKFRGLAWLLLYGAMFLFSFKYEVVSTMILMAVSLGVIMRSVLLGSSIQERLRDWPPGVAYDTIFIIVLSLTAIGVFATTLYGHIKPQFGGGQPPRVRVVISDANRTLFRPSFLPSPMESMLADTQLIDSTDKAIVVLLKSSSDDKGVAFQIDRSLIDAVLYLATP